MDAATLHAAIAEVCPSVVSTTVGVADDRSTWSFEPGTATQAQIDAGNNVIATIPIEPLQTVVTGEFISRWTNAEYALLQQRRVAGNPGGKTAKDYDNVTSDPAIDMNKKKVQTLRDDLVSAGVLTAERADEIFS